MNSLSLPDVVLILGLVALCLGALAVLAAAIAAVVIVRGNRKPALPAELPPLGGVPARPRRRASARPRAPVMIDGEPAPGNQFHEDVPGVRDVEPVDGVDDPDDEDEEDVGIEMDDDLPDEIKGQMEALSGAADQHLAEERRRFYEEKLEEGMELEEIQRLERQRVVPLFDGV